jgi:putative ABC transport system permease protein
MSGSYLKIALLNKYLGNYGYHIQLNIWIFILALFITLVVAGLAISYQLFSAIYNDPAKSLKYE